LIAERSKAKKKDKKGPLIHEPGEYRGSAPGDLTSITGHEKKKWMKPFKTIYKNVFNTGLKRKIIKSRVKKLYMYGNIGGVAEEDSLERGKRENLIVAHQITYPRPYVEEAIQKRAQLRRA